MSTRFRHGGIKYFSKLWRWRCAPPWRYLIFVPPVAQVAALVWLVTLPLTPNGINVPCFMKGIPVATYFSMLFVPSLYRRGTLPLRARLVAEQFLICPQCGYSLQGLPSQSRCPECGEPQEREKLRQYWRGWLRDDLGVIS